MYVKLTNGQPETYTIGQLRKDNPNTSFPKTIPAETLAAFDVYPAFDVPKPAATELQTVRQSGYVLDGLGNWTVTYEVVDKFSDILDENGVIVTTKAEAEAAYLASLKAAQVAEYTSAVQRHLDEEARTKNYDGILSACTYATSTNTTFAAEGQAAVQWRDSVWAGCYAILADVEAGNRTSPSVEELINELPTITWPA